MDKSTVLKAFNNLFFDFLDDILTVFPESKEINYAKSSFGLLKIANPGILIKAWYKRVYLPYKDAMDNGNVDFFFDKSYDQDLANVVGGDEIITMIENVKKPLKDMDETNKKHSSSYIQKLSKLSIIYQDFLK